MLISRAEAYEILELPIGADPDSIRLNYKRLVQKWHPEKNLKNGAKVSEEFQLVSFAYRRLTTDDCEDVQLTLPEMFDQYRCVFHPKLGSDSENADDKETSRSEKRRARKKKKRDKKRLENQNASGNVENNHNSKPNSDDQESNDDEEAECDGDKDQQDGDVNLGQVRRDEPPVSRDAQILLSRQLAMEGNKHANSGDYKQAVRCFTQAINIDPCDHRFFGNRSYCYDRLQLYDRALKDAEKTISLMPNWAKGHFRKGRALAGLKEYGAAEQCYLQVLQYDHNCPDALNELLNVRSHQLVEMGFSQHQAVEALKQHGTVPSVIDALLADSASNVDLAPPPPPADEFVTGHTSQQSTVPAVLKKKAIQAAPAPRLVKQQNMQQQNTQHVVDIKCDPDNVEGLTALWVGNVLPSVSEKQLHELFSKQGTITSIRMMPDKYCAFINFKTKDDASKALKNLQGVECGGQQLKVKFPDHPITANNAKKPTNGAHAPQSWVKKAPCRDDECYFWRTSGCVYGDRCRFRHIPGHAGIDGAGGKKQ